MYHRHPPTGWIDWDGPLRPRAIDTNKIPSQGNSPWDASLILFNNNLKLRVWHCDRAMESLARNGDGDEVLFIHHGSGDLFCDYGHMTFRDGDYIVLPRATSWRIEPKEPVYHAAHRSLKQCLPNGRARSLSANMRSMTRLFWNMPELTITSSTSKTITSTGKYSSKPATNSIPSPTLTTRSMPRGGKVT